MSDSEGSGIVVEVSITSDSWGDLSERLSVAARESVKFAGRQRGIIEIAVISDELIRKLNRQHLNHDWATDVISFSYDTDPGGVEGEVLVSWETAVRVAREMQRDPIAELTLYVIHGVLHLCGFDDLEPCDWLAMRAAERAVWEKLHGEPPSKDFIPLNAEP